MTQIPTQLPARLVVVDDHEFAREAVVASLEIHDDLQIVGQAGSVAEARAVIERTEPAVAVIDLRLPDGSGAELIEYFAKTRPELACVVYTSSVDESQTASLLQAGASAVILKSLRGNDLVDTIHDLATSSGS